MCSLNQLVLNDGSVVNVANYKFDAVKNIIDCASLCPSIDAIILFGSSLEERCTKDSDIDIAILSSKSVTGLSKVKSFSRFMEEVYLFDMNQEYDRLYFKSLEDIKNKSINIQICKEIAEKGKVIYRKDTE